MASGKSSVEFSVIKEYLGKVAKLVQVALPSLTNELFSRDLISGVEHGNAMNSNQSAYNRASVMIMSVLTKIESDCSCYDKFVSALKDSDLGGIAEMLESSLSSRKFGTSISPGTGIEQPLSATMSTARQTICQPSAHFTEASRPTGIPTTSNNSMSLHFTDNVLHSNVESMESASLPSEQEQAIGTILKERITEELQLDVLHLCTDDLVVFCEKAVVAGLVSQHVLDQLKTMHCRIPDDSKCRYVMQWIMKKVMPLHIGDNGILGRHINGDLLRIFINLVYGFFDIAQIKKYAIKSSNVLLKPAQALAANCDQELKEEDIARLCTILSDYSYLWDDMGIALGFSFHDLKKIEAEYSRNNRRLHSLLYLWWSRKYEYTKSPTLKCLKEMLSSNIVRLGRVSNKIQEEFIVPTSTTEICEKYYIYKGNGRIQIYTSHGITAREYNSACAYLLEVKIKLPTPDLRYEWYKNGNRVDSIGSDESILCIGLQDITDEGEYKCVCRLGDEVVESDPIIVHVETLLCKYKTQLVERYKSKPEVHSQTHDWPVVQQNTYIRLAVVGGEGRMSDKYYLQTIRGDADDVLVHSKASIEYQEAFQGVRHGDRVLVVGRPGSGKTTLVYRVSQDWANGSILGLAKALFFIYLRGFRSNFDIDLRRLVQCYFEKDEDVDVICRYIYDHRGLGICFILDGLDEYQPNINEGAVNFIFQLIRGDVLPCAVVIVASRPAAVASFTNTTGRHIEVLGFFREQVEEYIHSYEFSSFSKKSTLSKYLEHHPNIQHMCYLPIQTAMICFLFDEHEDTLPNTETMVYYEFTKHTVLRALYRKSDLKNKTLPSLESLEAQEQDMFLKVCKVAFELTKVSKQAIQQEEIKNLIDGSKINESLGLITIDWKATLCGFQNMYSFCHLTLQEFLAAYHISTLEIQEQLAIIQSCGPMKHMYMVFKFYCGLVKFDEHYSQFKRLLEVGKFETLHKLQCCFESQQPATSELVVDRNMIVVDKSFRTPSDYTYLGYVVVNATQNLVRMLHFETKLDEECAEAFMNATMGDNKPIVPVELLANSSCDDLHWKLFVACPSLLVAHCPLLPIFRDEVFDIGLCTNLEIILTGEDIGASLRELHVYPQAFPNLRKFGSLYVNMDNLECLRRSFTRFHSVYCMAISTFCNDDFRRAEAISIVHDMICTLECVHYYYDYGHDRCLCTNLCIFNCNINNETAALLAGGLKYNTSLEVLKLVANSIGDEGAVAIADSVKCCSSLQCLDLSLNRIGDRGAVALVRCTEDRSSLDLLLFGNIVSDSIAGRECYENKLRLWHTLDISECVGDVGLARVVYIMKEWTPPLPIVRTLRILYLQSCNNSPDCIEEVTGMLSRSTSLQSVCLVHINVHDKSVRLLTGCLDHKFITVLNLSHNSISDNGAVALAGAIKECRQLSVLDLSGNCIEDAGAEILCGALKSCKLRTLNLSCNAIGATGALAVSGVLKFIFKSLESLRLSSNRLGDVGTICLVQGLKHCSGLKQLYLSNNFIGCFGTEALAKSLHTCEQLSSLHLSDNEIGDAGACFLGKCLKHCSRLQCLMLNNNLISGVGAADVAEGVKQCSSLHTLEIGGNILQLEDVNRLASIFKNCVHLQRLFVASDYVIGNYETSCIDI